jgi:steroid delta-isomerase-like uncharacterized protein
VSDSNKKTIRRYVDELNARNFDVIEGTVGSEVKVIPLVRGATGSEVVSREEYRRQIEERVTLFPDYTVTIDELIAERDIVVLFWTSRRLHSAELMGVPPTGRLLSETAVTIYRLSRGRIVEVRGFWDRADLWEQLGLITVPTDDA